MADLVSLTIDVDTRQVVKATGDIGKLGNEAQTTSTKVDKFGKSTKRTAQDTSKFTNTINKLRGAVGLLSAGIAGVGIVNLAQQVERATTQMNNINATMTVAAGSASKAGEQIAFIRKESERLGLFFPSVAKQMAQFSAAARTSTITGEELEVIFTGIAEASRAMGLTAPQAEGAMLALQQMMSKGKVSAEELRQQLGERMPGSIQIMASALDISTEKLFDMMENGELLSEEVLPKFGAELTKVFSAQAELQANKIAAAIQRLRTAFFDLMAQDGLVGATKAIDELADIVASESFARNFDAIVTGISNLGGILAKNIDLIIAFSSAASGIVVQKVLLYLANLTKSLGMLAAGARATIPVMGGLAIALNKVKFTLMGLAGPAGAIIGVASAFMIFNNNSKEARLGASSFDLSLEELDGRLKDIVSSANAASVAILRSMQVEARPGLDQYIKDSREIASVTREIAGLEAEVNRAMDETGRSIFNVPGGRELNRLRAELRALVSARDEFAEDVEAYGMIQKAINEVENNINDLESSTRSASASARELRAEYGKFGPLIPDLDDVPPAERSRVQQAQKLLDIIQNTSVSQEELLSIVKKTGEEGGRIYSDMEQSLRDVGSVIKDDISNGLTDIIMQAESAKDVFQSLLNTIARTLIQQQVVDPFVSSIGASLPSFFAGGGAGSTSIGGGAPPNVRGIGPARANGGNVYGNTAHLVGERGPELFVPRQDGSVVPNNRMGGGNISINVINEGGDPVSVKEQSVRKSANGDLTVDMMIKKSIDRLDSRGELDGMFRRHGGTRQGRM